MKTSPTQIDIAFKAIEFIASRYHVTLSDLEGPCREERILWPRWFAMLLVRHYTCLPWDKIGSLFNRQGESVRYAMRTLEDQTQIDCARGREMAQLVHLFSFLMPAPTRFNLVAGVSRTEALDPNPQPLTLCFA
jgi:chromosomal replication initiation ATPase DnaA